VQCPTTLDFIELEEWQEAMILYFTSTSVKSNSFPSIRVLLQNKWIPTENVRHSIRSIAEFLPPESYEMAHSLRHLVVKTQL
jgi:hypothetical protein